MLSSFILVCLLTVSYNCFVWSNVPTAVNQQILGVGLFFNFYTKFTDCTYTSKLQRKNLIAKLVELKRKVT